MALWDFMRKVDVYSLAPILKGRKIASTAAVRALHLGKLTKFGGNTLVSGPE